MGGAGENGRESRAPLHRVVAEVIVVVIVADGGRDRRITVSATATADVVLQRLRCSPFGIAATMAAATSTAAVLGATARHWRYSSSVIAVAPLGVTAKRGEDPAVDGSHGGEEGGGIEDNDDDKYHNGGGGRGGGTAELSLPSPPLTPLEPSPMSAL